MHIKPEGITVIAVGKQVETAQQLVFYRCRLATAERPFSQHTLQHLAMFSIELRGNTLPPLIHHITRYRLINLHFIMHCP